MFTDQVFLGQSFPSMLVYVWSRRNPLLKIHFLGFLSFHARFLPWGLVVFSLMLGNSIVVDVLGTQALPQYSQQFYWNIRMFNLNFFPCVVNLQKQVM